ncbi:hypothetical protein AOQ84DRAFT_151224 [Glonium stellatum]|uniref:Uncharacterized protein n=1 Tax=Glonium stellatum TaxID=574774 RepID=A0A8E2F8J9_9PEZI|nr:hypothetical protein AOQ84DRAFT_151224 [Glonium stellatum]
MYFSFRWRHWHTVNWREMTVEARLICPRPQSFPVRSRRKFYLTDQHSQSGLKRIRAHVCSVKNCKDKYFSLHDISYVAKSPSTAQGSGYTKAGMIYAKTILLHWNTSSLLFLFPELSPLILRPFHPPRLNYYLISYSHVLHTLPTLAYYRTDIHMKSSTS